MNVKEAIDYGIQNLENIDDKILKKSAQEGKTPEEVSTYWYKRFSDSMKALNNLKPDIEPFATKTLGEMIAMVKVLIEKGFAYESNGDVYFRVKKFPKYGYLSKQPIDQLESGARIEELSKEEKEVEEKGVRIDSIKLEKEDNNLFLRIVIDSDEIIDVDKCVEVTNIINPLLDEKDLIEADKAATNSNGYASGNGVEEKAGTIDGNNYVCILRGCKCTRCEKNGPGAS